MTDQEKRSQELVNKILNEVENRRIDAEYKDRMDKVRAEQLIDMRKANEEITINLRNAQQERMDELKAKAIIGTAATVIGLNTIASILLPILFVIYLLILIF